MKSKTSYSNLTLFRQCLRRYWPLWGMILIIMIFLGPVPLANRIMWIETTEPHYADVVVIGASATNVYNMLSMIPIYAFAAGIIAALPSFDFLFSTKLTGLMASIPVKRERVFLQHYFAGLCMLLSSLLITALAILGVQAAHHTVTFAAVAKTFAISALECVIFYSIAVFCCNLTGNILVAIALYLLVNLGGALLWWLLDWFISTFVFGVDTINWGHWMFWLSPVVELEGNTLVTDAGKFEGTTAVLIYTAVAILLTIFSLLIFRRRQMERAQDTVAFPKLRPVLKYIVTLFAALGVPLLVSIIADTLYAPFSLPEHLLLTVIGAALGYVISEMIIQKSIHVFQKKNWIGLAAAALVCCLVVCGLRLDWLGIGHYIPEASHVKLVEIDAGEAQFFLDSEETIQEAQRLHQAILDAHDKGELSEEIYDEPNAYINIIYYLKNGDMEARSYNIEYSTKPDSLAQTIETALNSELLYDRQETINPPVPITTENVMYCDVSYRDDVDTWDSINLTPEELVDLYENGIRPDCMTGAFGPVKLTHSYGEDERYDVNINISLYFRSGDPRLGNTFLFYTPTVNTVNTNAWLEAHDIPLVPAQAPSA